MILNTESQFVLNVFSKNIQDSNFSLLIIKLSKKKKKNTTDFGWNACSFHHVPKFYLVYNMCIMSYISSIEPPILSFSLK